MTKYKSPLESDDVRQICFSNGLKIDDFQWSKLEKWSTLFLKENQKVNLISRRDTNYLWEKHILSCLTLLIFNKFDKNSEICDFGTGGGLPGILLAIVRPDLNLILFESRKKKVNAVNQMIEALKISNAQIILGRGEELGKKSEWSKRFTCITSRAVGSLEDLEHWTKDLRSEKSVIHLFKGGDIKKEINALLKKKSGLKIKSSLINLTGYKTFANNKKFLISLRFDMN